LRRGGGNVMPHRAVVMGAAMLGVCVAVTMASPCPCTSMCTAAILRFHVCSLLMGLNSHNRGRGDVHMVCVRGDDSPTTQPF
jgi:hypothetical protein